jgi:hypothetical protein
MIITKIISIIYLLIIFSLTAYFVTLFYPFESMDFNTIDAGIIIIVGFASTIALGHLFQLFSILVLIVRKIIIFGYFELTHCLIFLGFLLTLGIYILSNAGPHDNPLIMHEAYPIIFIALAIASVIIQITFLFKINLGLPPKKSEVIAQ